MKKVIDYIAGYGWKHWLYVLAGSCVFALIPHLLSKTSYARQKHTEYLWKQEILQARPQDCCEKCIQITKLLEK